MIPLCNNLENFCQVDPGIDKSRHGYGGPVHISDGGLRAKSETTFIDTITDMGMKEVVELQDFN